ncbi:glycosyltransferase family 4 protein [Caldibacillus sp. 210928-DFI.2.22]|uniref:glycosyltransferase family 4 protein n=1 Tax=unclassified Caldibacillus TaxID=2641266 RepID=UPI001D06AF1D|nr:MULTISPECIES: glycosyltransferase family 4 protein [unclassified Caldibacillus]MCB7070219.1 glycosyltransferase family 4 protein [Caldibacillus sp. 210928-DFI.2.22]MCB7073822.1 glycosyltransferase family 4 protein [Caldibacillus sp. 210928-DFI.2.18]
MKILWLINIPLPEASELLNENPSPFGGWLINASKDLARQQGINLTIAFPKKGVSTFVELRGEKITYYAFKALKDKDKELIEDNHIFKDIIKRVKPDLVHIYGTEMAHTLSMVNICNKLKIETVISTQGLVSIISQHTFANLPWKVVYGSTLRNLLRGDSVIGLQKLYYKRGKNEVEAIKKVKHIIGRTTWDRACTSQINPKAQYYFCNETLRDEFYNHEWDIEKCERYSLFLSQAHYPIKGLHYVVQAMPHIIKKYPNTKLYISGKDIIKSDTIKDKLLMTYYGKFIKRLIKDYKLENNIVFTGSLSEFEMCKRYLSSNVFVCPSSIENSPNSLGEAMILGVPCVASYVGGIPDMLKHGEDGFLYQPDAPYMLAHYVCEIFKNNGLALQFSKNARARAWKRHYPKTNTDRLIEIYEDILQKKE